jgi:hypothetical protein
MLVGQPIPLIEKEGFMEIGGLHDEGDQEPWA